MSPLSSGTCRCRASGSWGGLPDTGVNVRFISFTPPLLDSDGDGVADGVDVCPGSDLRAFVDTGSGPMSIPNVVNGVGCSIQDLVNRAAAGAKNHGHYVNAIKDLAARLLGEGVISAAQAKQMHLGAAHARKK
jgi:hypothetical protein